MEGGVFKPNLAKKSHNGVELLVLSAHYVLVYPYETIFLQITVNDAQKSRRMISSLFRIEENIIETVLLTITVIDSMIF